MHRHVRVSCCRQMRYLVLLGRHRDAGRLAVDDEARDSLVALRGVGVRHHQEDARLAGIGDPHLVAVQHPRVALALGGGLHGERIAARRLLRQAEAANLGFGTRLSVLLLPPPMCHEHVRCRSRDAAAARPAASGCRTCAASYRPAYSARRKPARLAIKFKRGVRACERQQRGDRGLTYTHRCRSLRRTTLTAGSTLANSSTTRHAAVNDMPAPPSSAGVSIPMNYWCTIRTPCTLSDQ